MTVPISLEGKIALVSGARRGIGQAVALRFAEAGADVAVCDYVAGDELDVVAGEINKLGRRSLAAQVDIRNKVSVNNLVQKVEDKLGGIDILANVAGISPIGPLIDLTEEVWDSVLDTNLKGTFLMCQAVLKGMVKHKRGNIINISSVDAFTALPKETAYSSSKAGVQLLTTTLSFEVGKYNIRVNCIAPGWIKTPMTNSLGVDSDPTSVNGLVVANMALGRRGESIEIANVALFLASDLASFVTGAIFRVDGGTSAPPLSTMPDYADELANFPK